MNRKADNSNFEFRISELSFSQSSLQDYVDCARRFKLRYLEGCRWPAPDTADALEFERYTQRGQAFHRLMRQLHSGISASALERVAAQDMDVARWWANYQRSPPVGLPEAVREAEWMLSAAVAGHRLEARYDLLAGEPGQGWMIVDWKTGRHRTRREWLTGRLQTRIYPFVLVEAGAGMNCGQAIRPEQVEMCYWFSEFPVQVERFAYSQAQRSADGIYLEGLIAEIQERAEQLATEERGIIGSQSRLQEGYDPSSEAFAKTDDKAKCRHCVYRSLCWEDVEAGTLAEAEAWDTEVAELEDLDLESLAPIPY